MSSISQDPASQDSNEEREAPRVNLNYLCLIIYGVIMVIILIIIWISFKGSAIGDILTIVVIIISIPLIIAIRSGSKNVDGRKLEEEASSSNQLNKRISQPIEGKSSNYQMLRDNYITSCQSILGMKGIEGKGEIKPFTKELMSEELKQLPRNPTAWVIHNKYLKVIFRNFKEERITPEDFRHPARKAEKIKREAENLFSTI